MTFPTAPDPAAIPAEAKAPRAPTPLPATAPPIAPDVTDPTTPPNVIFSPVTSCPIAYPAPPITPPIGHKFEIVSCFIWWNNLHFSMKPKRR